MYIIKNDGEVSVYYNQIPIMKNISVYSNTTSKRISTQLESVNESENKIMLRYSDKEERFFAEVSFAFNGNSFSVDIDTKLQPVYLMPEINSFDEDAGVVICFDVDKSKGFVAGYMESRWWRYVDFNKIPEIIVVPIYFWKNKQGATFSKKNNLFLSQLNSKKIGYCLYECETNFDKINEVKPITFDWLILI